VSDEVLEFVCPRCANPSTGRFYGPCSDCREALRAAFTPLARDVAMAGYEPKMNVTPNAVASKD